jgi:hypothetical protein
MVVNENSPLLATGMHVRVDLVTYLADLMIDRSGIASHHVQLQIDLDPRKASRTDLILTRETIPERIETRTGTRSNSDGLARQRNVGSRTRDVASVDHDERRFWIAGSAARDADENCELCLVGWISTLLMQYQMRSG